MSDFAVIGLPGAMSGEEMVKTLVTLTIHRKTLTFLGEKEYHRHMAKKKDEQKVKLDETDDIPEVKRTVIDDELENNPLRKRPGHPSHKGYNRLSAKEEAVAKRKFANSGKVRKSRQFDGRALSKRPRRDQVMKTFYEEVDLPEFKDALNFSKDPKFRMLFEAISSPRLHKCSFAELCRRCGLNIHDISNIYRDHQKHRGLMRAYAHMPRILEDTAVDAQTRVVTCALCDGSGKVTGEDAVNKQKISICPKCHGDGKERLIGDKDSRQLMFESAGLRKGGAVQAVQVNVGGAVPELEDVIGDVEDALDVTPEGEENVRNGATEGPKQISSGDPTAEEDAGDSPGDEGDETVH